MYIYTHWARSINSLPRLQLHLLCFSHGVVISFSFLLSATNIHTVSFFLLSCSVQRCLLLDCLPPDPILMTAGTAVSDMGDEPVPELRNADQDEHATTTRRHSSSSATRQRRDPTSLTFLERLSLIRFARHTLGIFLLLITVLLFTTSNFLSSVSLQPSEMP